MNFSRKRKQDAGSPLAPLLDVVLLLLIFFVVSTSFAERQLSLELPGAESGVSAEQAPLVISISSSGSVFVENHEIDTNELDSRLRSEVSSVEIRADRTADHGSVVGVLDLVRQAGIETVGIGVGYAEK